MSKFVGMKPTVKDDTKKPADAKPATPKSDAKK